MIKPSTRCSVDCWSPARNSAGLPVHSRRWSWTSDQPVGSIFSTSRASATNQSAPEVTLPRRSAYPEAVMFSGAFWSISRSATTALGAGQESVCFNPSFSMEAPNAVYPSIEAAVPTHM